MENILKKAVESKEYIESKINMSPKIGIILGSGLGEFVENIMEKTEIEYKDIPNFPVSTIKGHSGKLIIGKVSGKEVIVMSGRFHYYEGYSMQEVVFPIRVFSLLGIEKMVITNAAGGININFNPGDLMIIKDHIKFSNETPLRGANIEEFGTRFPDMRKVYDKEMINIIKESAKEVDVHLQEGVFCYMGGPQYETAAEVNMLKLLGGDSVSMSTVPEVIACSHSDIKVLGISCITNVAKPDTMEVSHEEVIENAAKASNDFSRVMLKFLERIK